MRDECALTNQTFNAVGRGRGNVYKRIEFGQQPVVYQPGTHFLYNTMGSYVLSAIVTKVTGETTLEFLKPRLFTPLRIAKESEPPVG